jgi:tetratricopeptide (TPR) repeat protein
MSIRPVALALFTILTLVSCNRDPEVAKRRYLQSGNKYFDKGRYVEAKIQYSNALKIDQKYGLAHYKLAVTLLKITPPDWVRAVKELRRAIEPGSKLPTDQPEHWDAVVKLTEIYLSPLLNHTDDVIREVEGFCATLLNRDPNSFDGHRLTGDLNYVKAVEASKVKRVDDGRKFLAAALQEYRKAEAIKAGDQGVSMQLARGLTLNAEYPAAEQYYRQIIAKDPKFLQAYRELYTLLWYQGRKSDSEAVLKTGYQKNPKEFRFLIGLAQQYLMENRRGEMLGVLQQIKSKAGEYPAAYLDVGDFYLRTGDADSAVREYKEGIGRDGKNKPTYQKRIVEVLMQQGKRAEAADVNSQILKDNPKDPDARGVTAALLLDRGDVTKAMTELQAVVTRAPENPVFRYNLGRAYAMHNDLEQARQQFQKAIELRPTYILARLALAQLQVAHADFEAALRTTREVIAIDPQNVNARLIESAALMGQKKFGDSRQLLDDMLKANPRSPDAQFQLGVVNLAEKKFKDAEDAFRRAYQLNPANTRGMMGVVETYMAQNKPDQAMQLLEAEAAKAPTRMDFHLALGNIAVRTGRWDKAIAEYQGLLAGTDKGSKQQGEVYLRIGEAQRRKGDLNAAIASLQSARQTLPEDERVLSTLALALDGAGRWSEARQFYEATMKLYPENGVVLNNLAFGIAEHGGDLDYALTMANRAKTLIPDMAEVSDTLGWIYLKKNLSDNAVEIFKDLVAKRPDQSIFRYHLGMAYSQKGDKAKAAGELKKALTQNPTNEERQKIQDLLNRLG